MGKLGAMAVILGLCAMSAFEPAWGQDPGKLPTWAPAEARLKQLGAEEKFEGWAIRGPQGYPHRTKKDDRETRTTWVKQGAGGLTVNQANNPAEPITLEQGLDRIVTLMKGRFKNVNHTPFERGTIDGKIFIRTRFSGEGLPGVDGRGFGFVYTTFDAKTPIVITGFGTEKAIEDLESSALSLKVLP